MKRERSEQRERILQAAILVAEKKGYQHFTRNAVAQQAEISGSLVQFHFHTIQLLKDAVLAEAVVTENLRIIAQAALVKDGSIGISPELKQKAINHVITESG